MPYISQDAREQLDLGKRKPTTPGELNYAITKLIVNYLPDPWDLSYADIATVTGVLENAKQELYARLGRPYEDEKMKVHGAVY